MQRTRVVWTGVAGTPYYSTFYWNGSDLATAEAAHEQTSSWASVVAQFANDELVLQVESEVTEINPETGVMVTVRSIPGTTYPGLNTAQPLPFQTQALTFFNTSAVRNGRRVRGRNFLPGLSEEPNTSGAGPIEVTRAQIQSIYSEFLNTGDADLVVWSRPRDGGPAGETNVVSGFQTSAVWSTLRSRRAA